MSINNDSNNFIKFNGDQIFGLDDIVKTVSKKNIDSKYHALFDIVDGNYDGQKDGKLSVTELSLFLSKLIHFAGEDANKSVFSRDEAEEYTLGLSQDSGQEIKTSELFEFISKIKSLSSGVKEFTVHSLVQAGGSQNGYLEFPKTIEEVKSRINEYLNSDRYKRETSSDGIVSISENGKIIAKILKSGEIQFFHSQNEAWVFNKNSGEFLFDVLFESDGSYTTKYLSGRYERTNSDGTETQVFDKENNLVGRIFKEFDENGNIVSQKEIQYKKDEKTGKTSELVTVLDANRNGYKELNGEKFEEIRSTLDPKTGSIIYQDHINIKTKGCTTIYNPEFISDEEAKTTIINSLISDVESALDILRIYASNESGTDAFIQVASSLIGASSVGDKLAEYQDLLNKLNMVKTKTDGYSFESAWKEIFGVDYNEGAVKTVVASMKRAQEIAKFSGSIKTIENYFSTNSENMKDQAIKTMAGILGDYQAAYNWVEEIYKKHPNDSEGAIQEIREKLTSMRTEFSKQLSEVLPEGTNPENFNNQMEQVYKNAFGEKYSVLAENYIQRCEYASMGVEILGDMAITIGTGGLAAATVGPRLIARFGPKVGQLLIKAISVGASATTTAGVTYLNTGSLEAAGDKFEVSLVYGGFGAFVSGPLGETVQKVLSKNAGLISSAINKAFNTKASIGFGSRTSQGAGALAETTADVIFDRLTSDVSLKESFMQNGGMNFAMMFVGGRLHSKVQSHLAGIKVTKTADGSFVVKDNGQEIICKNAADLTNYIFVKSAEVDGVKDVAIKETISENRSVTSDFNAQLTSLDKKARELGLEYDSSLLAEINKQEDLDAKFEFLKMIEGNPNLALQARNFGSILEDINSENLELIKYALKNKKMSIGHINIISSYADKHTSFIIKNELDQGKNAMDIVRLFYDKNLSITIEKCRTEELHPDLGVLWQQIQNKKYDTTDLLLADIASLYALNHLYIRYKNIDKKTLDNLVKLYNFDTKIFENQILTDDKKALNQLNLLNIINLSEIEYGLASISDEKFKTMIRETIKESFPSVNPQLIDIVDCYNNLTGNYVTIKSKYWKQYLDFVKTSDPELYNLIKNKEFEILAPENKSILSKFKEFITKKNTPLEQNIETAQWTRIEDFRVNEFYESQRVDSFVEYCKNNKNKMSDYLYNNVYLNRSNFTPEIKDKLSSIAQKYNVKIFLDYNCGHSKETLEYIEQELETWIKASNGKAKLPPVIDLTTAKTDYIDSNSAYGSSFTAGFSQCYTSGSISLVGSSIGNTKYALRHEMTHTNDLKMIQEFPEGYVTKDSEGKIIVTECKYYQEFVNIGIPESHISYAYNNPLEFIAVASEGNLSKCSPEFKQALMDFGLPAWRFDME